jgi:hypothetical protein
MTDVARPAEVGDLDDVDVDAAAAVRGLARRDARIVALGLPCYVAGFAVLHVQPERWTAPGWALVAAAVLAWAGLASALVLVVSRSEWRQRRYLAEYAVLHHLDPGLGRRQAADRRARNMSWARSFAITWAAFLVGQTLAGDLDDPAWAAAGIGLFALALAVLVPSALREARASRRWLADPPGPPRD